VKREGSLSFLTIFTFAVPVIGLDMTENRIFTLSYDNLSSVSQNVLKFYQQLTGAKRRVPFSFGYGNRLGSGRYILVSCAHSNTSSFCNAGCS
jgi:hypothetical protein